MALPKYVLLYISPGSKSHDPPSSLKSGTGRVGADCVRSSC